MAIEKTIKIDGTDVKFKASAAITRMYRNKFGRDIFKDMGDLQKISADGSGIESMEVFENIIYIMAKHADPKSVSDSVDEFLEQFGTFSIYQILPQIIELWGLNNVTMIDAKKK